MAGWYVVSSRCPVGVGDGGGERWPGKGGADLLLVPILTSAVRTPFLLVRRE